MPENNEPIYLTRAQVREIDRRSVEEYHIPSIVLMENAARGATDALMRITGGHRRIVIICGSGNNGGDGLAIARHAHNLGANVEIIAATTDRFTGDALINWNIVQAMGIKTTSANAFAELNSQHAAVVVDALFGTGLSRPPEGNAASLINQMNASGVPILSIDVPSGLDCDTGHPLGVCVRATETVTFVAPKIGFTNPAAAPFLGRVTVSDIGCPRDLIEAIRRT